MRKKNNNPIGVFDSGMGGLTVLKALHSNMPGESYLYFGDTAHLPYGTKSPNAVKEYALRAGEFFKEKEVKLMVVACNTASVYALGELKKRMPFQVVGVIGPGIKAALREGINSIGVIGTYATIKSGIYRKGILKKRPDIKVSSRACPLFVPLVEEGWLDNEITRQVAEIYLKDFACDVDSLILGCTHYPLLKKVVKEVVGPEVNIIDSAREVSKETERILSDLDIKSCVERGNLEFYVSDAPELFKKGAEIFLDSEIKTERVLLKEML